MNAQQIGGYKLLGRIGEGAMGVVYLWRLRPGGSRPRSHGLTVAAIALAVPLTLALLLAVGLRLG